MTSLEKHNCQKDFIKMLYFSSEINISTSRNFEQVISQINKILCDEDWKMYLKNGIT